MLRNLYSLVWIIAIVGIIVFYLSAFFPGYLTADSIYILHMASGVEPVSNWHPPFNVLMTKFLIDHLQHFELIWIVQLGLYIGAALVASKCFPPVSLFVFLTLTLFPPITTNMAALWKDDLAVTFTLYAMSFAIYAFYQKRLDTIFLSIIFCCLSTAVRVDYFIIIMPIIIILTLIVNSLFYGKKNRIIYTILPLMIFISLHLAIGSITKSRVEQKFNSWAVMAAWDIFGTAIKSNKSTLSIGDRKYTRANMEEYYNCATSDSIVFGKKSLLPFNLPGAPQVMPNKIEATLYSSFWLESILSNPLEYISHKICIAKVFFGLEPAIHFPYPGFSPENRYTGLYKRSQLNIDLYWFYDAHAHGIMFRYWIYLVVASILLVFSFFLFRNQLSVFITIYASILMSASRVLVLPAADFRYGLWIVVGAILLMFTFFNSLIDRLWPNSNRNLFSGLYSRKD